MCEAVTNRTTTKQAGGRVSSPGGVLEAIGGLAVSRKLGLVIRSGSLNVFPVSFTHGEQRALHLLFN